MDWFSVDKQGLAKILQRNGAAFIIRELWANAIDEQVRRVSMAIQPVPGSKKLYSVAVEDDSPEGFANLKDSFTLFAESKKKQNPSQRGRFNLGEKLVLAVCEEATIQSTKGAIRFDKDGRHESYHPSSRRPAGTIFKGVMPLTKDDLDEINKQVRSYIIPEGVEAYFNGKLLDRRIPIATTNGTLETELSDGSGVLRRSRRKTEIRIFEPLPGYKAALYELGVPVVETGDKFDVDICMKIPLTIDRDNVPSAYLQDVRTLVLNKMYDRIEEADANSSWVRDAASDKNCAPEAMKKVVRERFGDKAVVFDPSDLEANSRAVSQGYTVVHGSMLNKQEWDNVRESSLILPAGQVTPTPKPFTPGGKPLHYINPEEYSDRLRYAVRYAINFAKHTICKKVTVHVTDALDWRFNAAFSKDDSVMILSYPCLERYIESETGTDEWTYFEATLIHELGHHYESDHLSEKYHKGLCVVGAMARRYAAEIVKATEEGK